MSTIEFKVGPFKRERIKKWIEMLKITSLRVQLRRQSESLLALADDIRGQLESQTGYEVELLLENDEAYCQTQTTLISIIHDKESTYASIDEMKDMLLECDQAQKRSDPEAMRMALQLQNSDPNDEMHQMVKNFLNNPPWERHFVPSEK